MKKYDLLKVIGIFFLCFVVLSWIFPIGSYSNGELQSASSSPIGLFDLFRTPLSTIGNFLQLGIVLLLLGGLYGVMNKTGVYSSLVNSIVEKFKGKERVFVIISIIMFAILSSLTNANFVLFVLVPFFTTIILLMGYNKITAMLSTVGAILVGAIGSTYGFNISGYINEFLSTGINSEILARAIFFALITFLLIFFTLKTNKIETKTESKKIEKTTKKAKKEEKETIAEEKKDVKIEIPLYEKTENKKKSYWPLLIIFGLMFLIILVATIKWQGMFKISFFEEIYENMMSLKIGDYTIIKNIIGGINPFGYWGISELAIMLVIASIIIGWLYSIKFNDLLDSFIKGAKVMVPAAIYAVLANVIFSFIVTSQTGQNFYYPIADHILNITKDFNAATMSLTALLGSLFYNDFPYLLYGLSSAITTKYDANLYPLIGFIFQSLHGLMMLVLPTSVLLVTGLAYLNISIKEWLKSIWKYLLQVLAVSILIMIVLAIFL